MPDQFLKIWVFLLITCVLIGLAISHHLAKGLGL